MAASWPSRCGSGPRLIKGACLIGGLVITFIASSSSSSVTEKQLRLRAEIWSSRRRRIGEDYGVLGIVSFCGKFKIVSEWWPSSTLLLLFHEVVRAGEAVEITAHAREVGAVCGLCEAGIIVGAGIDLHVDVLCGLSKLEERKERELSYVVSYFNKERGRRRPRNVSPKQ